MVIGLFQPIGRLEPPYNILSPQYLRPQYLNENLCTIVAQAARVTYNELSLSEIYGVLGAKY